MFKIRESLRGLRDLRPPFLTCHIIALTVLSIPLILYINWYNSYNVGLFQREPWRLGLWTLYLLYLLFLFRSLEKRKVSTDKNILKTYADLISFSQKAFLAFAVYFIINSIAHNQMMQLLLLATLPPLEVLTNIIIWSTVTGVLASFGLGSLVVLLVERRLIETAKLCLNWLRVPVGLLMVAFAWGIWYATPLYMISLRFVEVSIAYLAMQFIQKKATPAQLQQIMDTIHDEGVKVLVISASLGAFSIGAFNTMISTSVFNILQNSDLPLRPLYTSMLTAATNYVGVLFIVVWLVVAKLIRSVSSPDRGRMIDLFSIWFFLLAVITFLDALSQTIGPLREIMNYLWTHPS